MSELDEAVRLANRVLDQIRTDPDDDIAVLARQFLRAKERADRSTARLVELTEPGSIGAFAARDHWKAEAERLRNTAPDFHAIACELDRLCLVIESAMRNGDTPGNLHDVLALIKANRAALAKAKDASLKTAE